MKKKIITAGVDEVGRGCLAGPVVSAAVILKEGINLDLLKDSKKIGFKKDVNEVIEQGVLIEDLEESYYAIAIYHDKNSNNKFDTFFAVPQERYGFSNNAPVFFGPPSFEDASFFVKDEGMTKIEINLR